MTASPNFPKLPEGWSEETGFLPSSDDQNKIFYRLFSRTPAKHQRLLFIAHGLGEQSDRFTHFPHYLQTSFDAIALIDHPGHGKSSGPRGHIENFDQFSQAVVAGFQFAKSKFPKMKSYHWLGCSMGGLITLRTMIRYPDLGLSSVAVAEPQLGIAVKVPFLKELLGTMVEPILGKIPLKNEIDAAILSHDLSVQNVYKENPLNHEYVSPRLYVNMKREMTELANFKGEFPYNLLMLVPLADQVVDWKKSFSFFQSLKMKTGTTKELCSFPNFYHEIFNEIERARPFTALEDWVRKQITK